ncbi:MAG: hypothetical protein QFB87_03755 [Patescibacteria group bacterium]|nr:hypothetical protein [Patescibacteria group bacterium]
MTRRLPKLTFKPTFTTANLWLRQNRNPVFLVGLFAVIVSSLLLRHLTSLPSGGLSSQEHQVAVTSIGWQGIIHDPFFLAVKLLRSVGFYFFGQGGILVVRLPSVIMAALAIVCLAAVVRLWHGTRVAILSCLLFAASAWTLHMGRYASYDSSYLAAVPALFLSQLVLKRSHKLRVVYLVLLVWGSLLFIPGMVWFIAVTSWQCRQELIGAWRQSRAWWRKVLLVIVSAVWLPLLLTVFIKHPRTTLTWLGLPNHFDAVWPMLRRLGAIPEQLFAYGPNNPAQWLGHLPILDSFSAVMVILGIVFYLKHWRSSRATQLAVFSVVAAMLISLNPAIGLSLVVPIIYLLAAAGIARLLRDWLQRFPSNPIMRAVGVGLITAAVAISCAYNLQHYFVAWPHNPATKSHFTYYPY